MSELHPEPTPDEPTPAEPPTPDEGGAVDAPQPPSDPAPEEDDRDPEPEPAPSPEPPEEPPPALSEREVEKRTQALVKEATRHANRVSEIMGEDAQLLVTCELCESHIPGFHWPANVLVQTGDPRAQVVQLLSAEEPEYAKASDARECESCQGLGFTLTGSKVPEHRTKACASCNGLGWVQVHAPTDATRTNGATETPQPVAPPEPVAETPEPPEVAALRAQGYVVVPPYTPA